MALGFELAAPKELFVEAKYHQSGDFHPQAPPEDPPRLLGEKQRQEVLEVLSQAGLPTEDLAHGSQAKIFALGPSHTPEGLVGLELYGRFGLLRSLVVSDYLRGRGLGKTLVRFAEQRAREQGVEELYLLTLSARDFFLKLGFCELDRKLAPEPIRTTSEFLNICPQSAVLMMKRLVG